MSQYKISPLGFLVLVMTVLITTMSVATIQRNQIADKKLSYYLYDVQLSNMHNELSLVTRGDAINIQTKKLYIQYDSVKVNSRMGIQGTVNDIAFDSHQLTSHFDGLSEEIKLLEILEDPALIVMVQNQLWRLREHFSSFVSFDDQKEDEIVLLLTLDDLFTVLNRISLDQFLKSEFESYLQQHVYDISLEEWILSLEHITKKTFKSSSHIILRFDISDNVLSKMDLQVYMNYHHCDAYEDLHWVKILK